MSRRYYLSVEVICDNCGMKDTLDDGSETKEQLEAHVNRYYLKKDGKDLCEDCARETSDAS